MAILCRAAKNSLRGTIVDPGLYNILYEHIIKKDNVLEEARVLSSRLIWL